MAEIYTVKELAEILECSLPVARKKVEKKEFKSTSKVILGRSVKAFYINNNNLDELIEEIKVNKKIYTKDKESSSEVVYESTSEGVYEYSENTEKAFQSEEKQVNDYNSSFLLEIMREYKNDLKSTYETFTNKLEEKNRQLLLLENSESSTKEEYSKIIAENKHLKGANETLKNENNELKEKIRKLEEELVLSKKNSWKFWK